MLQREETSACAKKIRVLFAKCSGDFKSPENKLLYSNVGDYEFGDFFSFLFLQTPVGVIILTWAQVARVTTLVTGQTKSRAPNLSGGHVY